MTHEQFDHEKNYGTSLAIAKMMLTKGIINEKDYQKIDTILLEKHQSLLGCLRH